MTSFMETDLELIEGALIKTAMAAEGGYHMSYILMRERRDGAAADSFCIIAAVMDDDGGSESACVRGIKVGEYDALRLFDMLVAGTVTPISLADVVDDFVG